MIYSAIRTLIGDPLPTDRMAHERLSNPQALAVLSSDALSSVAYASEEILLALMLVGMAATGLIMPISIAISVLLVIVSISYHQTIHAYPNGGGAYTVSRENLGNMPSLVAGGALLVDYVLTVAVSVSAGTAAITSAFPALLPFRVEIALATILFITIVNLRGLRESGRVFVIPTYFFVCMIYFLLLVGLQQIIRGGSAVAPIVESMPVKEVTLFLVLRAFAAGCTALTGVEAISNGISVFRKPESDNAARTLTWMTALLVTMFLGISFLAHQFNVVPVEGETVVSQIARTVFGDHGFYFVIQGATAVILFLAANTSYSDFPRLARLMAVDGYLPRQLANLGDRLVYANGMIVLGLLASVLIVLFRADTHRLVPLYAVGVFISFTLSQSGMVVHWWRLRGPGWLRSAIVNGVGATTTGLVLLIIAGSKFVHGAWIVLVLLGAAVFIFSKIHRHYDDVREQVDLSNRWPAPVRKHTVVLPVANLNRGTVKAVQYAQSLSGDIQVVTVAINPADTDALVVAWHEMFPDLNLIVLPSPYRSVIRPLMDHINSLIEEEGDYVTVVVPELVCRSWWQSLMHNQTAWALKMSLLYSRRDWRGRFRMIAEVPFYLSH